PRPAGRSSLRQGRRRPLLPRCAPHPRHVPRTGRAQPGGGRACRAGDPRAAPLDGREPPRASSNPAAAGCRMWIDAASLPTINARRITLVMTNTLPSTGKCPVVSQKCPVPSGAVPGTAATTLATAAEMAHVLAHTGNNGFQPVQGCPVLAGLNIPSVDLTTRCHLAQQYAFSGNVARGLLVLTTGLVDALRRCQVG